MEACETCLNFRVGEGNWVFEGRRWCVKIDDEMCVLNDCDLCE